MASKSMLSNSVYNTFNMFVQLILPAALTLYVTLATIWHWDHVTEVTASVAPAMAFLGLILRISNKSYIASNDRFGGNIIVTENEDGVKTYSLEVNGDPAAISDQKEITFKVS
jgi:hypothetical protein